MLLVEDEPLVREIAKSALSNQGYVVLEAEHGEEALRVAREHGAEIALVLTDVVMPKMGGRELVEQLREGPARHPRALHVRLRGVTIDEQDVIEPGTSFLAQAVRAGGDARQGARVLDARVRPRRRAGRRRRSRPQRPTRAPPR